MIVHLICGATAAARLREALSGPEGLTGEVLLLPDRLHHGPLHRPEGQSFTQVRAAYWSAIRPTTAGETPEEARDEACFLQAANLLQKYPDAQAWFWMAPHPADVVAYYRSLRYLGKHIGRLHLLNIAGLPFLDEDGKLFFPQSFNEVPVKEFIKARRLARPISPAELELDSEVWEQLSAPQSFYRFLQGGKKIVWEEETYFDRDLRNALRNGPAKAWKLVHTLVQKGGLPTDEAALLYRLKKLAAEGALLLKGDPQKSLRDWEASLPAANGALQSPSETQNVL